MGLRIGRTPERPIWAARGRWSRHRCAAPNDGWRAPASVLRQGHGLIPDEDLCLSGTMDGYESRWHSRALSWGGWMGSTSPPGRTAWRWRIMSFGGRGSHCGERASGNEPLTRPAKQGRGLAEASPRDLRHSPGPRGGHAATETDRRQPRQPTSEEPETQGSNVSGTHQLVLESSDTVAARSSILRSPTLNPPESGGF